MNIYHYSKELYDILKTRAKSGAADDKEILEQIEWNKKTDTAGLYSEHISFFFDPLPLSLLANIFGEGHHTWFKGNELYEYIINVDSLDKDIVYDIVETPLAINLLDKTEWVNTDEFLFEYKRNLNKLKRQSGEIGNNLSGLKSQISKYKGKTKNFYIAASERIDFKDNFNKYAANVPHVMVYPKSGTVNIELINQVIVGTDSRKHLKISQESLDKPNWTTW